MKKTYLLNDLVWMSLAFLVCLGGLKLGFGTFQQPQAGFMPFLSGLLLGLLALADLSSGFIDQWKTEKGDKEIWAGIDWRKLLLTMIVLFGYTALFSILGFIIGTILLLLFLFRVMEPKPWWLILITSLITTTLLYLMFKVGLDSQLPRGFWGF